MFGNMGNMQGMVKKMQKMQTDMAKKQEQIHAQEFEATAGSGVVCVTANGNKELLRIKIDPAAFGEDDTELLGDMIVVAVNEAHRKIDQTIEQEMAKITGGMKLPGLF